MTTEGLSGDLRGDEEEESAGLRGDFCGEGPFSLFRRPTGFFLGDVLFTGDVSSLPPLSAGWLLSQSTDDSFLFLFVVGIIF